MQDYGSRGAGPGASDLGASESAGTGTGNDSMGLNDSRRQGGAASPPPGRDHGGVRAGESDRLADDARGEGATPGVGDPAN
ncbi:MAG TPA: hypothetical protein VHG91_12055, partial [Longimicrobium sp.]|nr:hypothetical protein [Longimicrobium sp.]